MRTEVKFSIYRNGVRECTSMRAWNDNVSESYAKREIAREHRVETKDVEIINIDHK